MLLCRSPFTNHIIKWIVSPDTIFISCSRIKIPVTLIQGWIVFTNRTAILFLPFDSSLVALFVDFIESPNKIVSFSFSSIQRIPQSIHCPHFIFLEWILKREIIGITDCIAFRFSPLLSRYQNNTKCRLSTINRRSSSIF
ncbi:hypothetical protein D3C73_695150 [compost metagenome]